MNQKELRELIEFLVEKDIAEFEMERGDLKLHIKRGASAARRRFCRPLAVVAHAVPVAPVPSPIIAASAPAAAAEGVHMRHLQHLRRHPRKPICTW